MQWSPSLKTTLKLRQKRSYITEGWSLVRCTFTWKQEGTGGAWSGVCLHGKGHVVLGQVYIYMGTDRWCLVRCTFTWEQTGGAWLGVQLHGNRQVVLGQVYSYMGTDRWCLVRCTVTRKGASFRNRHGLKWWPLIRMVLHPGLQRTLSVSQFVFVIWDYMGWVWGSWISLEERKCMYKFLGRNVSCILQQQKWCVYWSVHFRTSGILSLQRG